MTTSFPFVSGADQAVSRNPLLPAVGPYCPILAHRHNSRGRRKLKSPDRRKFGRTQRLALLSSRNFSRSAGRYATRRAPRIVHFGPTLLARQFFNVLTDTPRYCAASLGLNTTGRSIRFGTRRRCLPRLHARRAHRRCGRALQRIEQAHLTRIDRRPRRAFWFSLCGRFRCCSLGHGRCLPVSHGPIQQARRQGSAAEPDPKPAAQFEFLGELFGAISSTALPPPRSNIFTPT